MAKKFVDFREAENPEVLQSIKNASSPQYQAMIPDATKGNIEDTVAALHKYPHLRNEFDRNLINRIGLDIFRSNSWHNPLAEFKNGMLPYGATVQEVQMGLLKARVHDEDRDSLEREVFGQSRPITASSFHTVNRKSKYKVTTDESSLQRAFVTENGLGKYIHDVVGSLDTSDQRDEFLLMARLLVMNHENDGYYLKNTDTIVDKDSAEDLLVKIRADVATLSFLSARYNAAGMEVAAMPEDMVVITTPEVKARIDVQSLAAAFNLPYAEVPTRVKALPAEYWPIDGAQAILTTVDFWQVWDTYMDSTTMQNPDGRYWNHWYHHDGIISLSRFVPAILYTDKPVTEQVNVQIVVESIGGGVAMSPDGATVTSVPRGTYAQIDATVKTNRDGVGEGKLFEIVSEVNSQITTVTQTGALITGVDESADSVTVKVSSLLDPTKSVEVTVTLTGEVVNLGFRREIAEPEEGEEVGD